MRGPTEQRTAGIRGWVSDKHHEAGLFKLSGAESVAKRVC